MAEIPADYPPLKSLEIPSTIPSPTSSILGRDARDVLQEQDLNERRP